MRGGVVPEKEEEPWVALLKLLEPSINALLTALKMRQEMLAVGNKVAKAAVAHKAVKLSAEETKNLAFLLYHLSKDSK